MAALDQERTLGPKYLSGPLLAPSEPRASIPLRKAMASSLRSCVGAFGGREGLFSVSSLPVVVQFVPLDATQAWCGWEHSREGLGQWSRGMHHLLLAAAAAPHMGVG